MKISQVNKVAGAVAVLTAGLILGGCASSPATYSSADQSVDFQKYKTYAFMQDLNTDQTSYQSLESTFLKEAVAKEMSQRGLVQSSNPDLVVNFAIDSKEKIRSHSVPASGIYADPWYGYGYGVGYQTRITQYTEGHLNIVVVDVESNRLVWEGSTKGRITAKVEENVQSTLKNAVTEVFLQFPIPAPVTSVSYSQQ